MTVAGPHRMRRHRARMPPPIRPRPSPRLTESPPVRVARQSLLLLLHLRKRDPPAVEAWPIHSPHVHPATSSRSAPHFYDSMKEFVQFWNRTLQKIVSKSSSVAVKIMLGRRNS
ncbi:hypothetical protein RB195_016664 [Necator americanus]|uniref:Uncharacterized protein n=1 Tax=Necator americanus TaxID=51031 RepID=A0ABR1C1L0_NECAM